MERKQSLKHTGIYTNHDLKKQEEERSRSCKGQKRLPTKIPKPGSEDCKREAVCGWTSINRNFLDTMW